jgi:hypothetical protein
MTDVTVRGYAAGDEVSINEGFNEVFGLARPLAEWRWKFPEQLEGRWIMVAVDAGEWVVAQYAAVPVRLRAGALEVRAGQIVDVFSRPVARSGLAAGRVFLTTADTFIERWCNPEGLAVCFGFPSNRPLRLGVRKTGYAQVPPQPVPLWRRPANPRGRWLTWHRVREGFDPPAIDALWRRASGRYAIAAVRDSTWLRRRFTGRPGVEYVHLSVWRRGEVHAWAVLRPGAPVTHWADLVWDGCDWRALAALDRAASVVARRAGAETLEMWLGYDAAAGTAFQELGWTVQEHPLVRMVVHTFHPAIPADSVPGRFYLTMGDSDLV